MRTEILNHLSSFQLTSLPFVGHRFVVDSVEDLEAAPRTLGSEFAKLKDAVPSRDELPAEAQRHAVSFLRWAANSIEQIELPVKKSAEETTEATAEVAVQAEQVEQTEGFVAQPAV
jgi:hypothetical protein